MMRKTSPFFIGVFVRRKVFRIVLLVCLILIIIYIFKNFKDEHSIDYILTTDNNSYRIVEKYNFKDSDRYFFSIIDRGNTKYLFTTSNGFGKKKKVITDIKLYEKGSLKCILPIYENESVGQLICNQDGLQVSYFHLLDSSNEEINTLLEFASKDGFKVIDDSKSDIKEKVDNYYFYRNNILDNVVFTMWFYKGFYVIDSNDIVRKEYFNRDKYENNLSLLVDNKYIFVNSDKGSLDYDEILMYDIDSGKTKSINLDGVISNNSYFNGVYDDLIYLTDINNKLQYTIDLNEGKVKTIGSRKEKFVRIYDNKLDKVSTKEFFSKKIYFDEVDISNELEKFDATSVKVDNDIYYYIDSNNTVYMVYRDYMNVPILLFNLESISEWKVNNGSIIATSGDTLYYYDDVFGLRKILVNSELKYNYKNICYFAKKVG